MKRFIPVFLLGVFIAASALAQKDADAQKILSAVSAKYKSYNGFKTDFALSVDNPQAGVKQSQTGTLVAKSKSNKFKVTLYSTSKGKAAAEQEIISDGKTQWTYLKKDNEVQVNDADKSGEGINPAQIFAIYEKGYKYVYTGDQKVNGRLCQVIELSPLDAKKSIFKARLFIDKAKKEIVSANLFDKNGIRYTYMIKNFTPQPQLSDAMFAFDAKAHPGVEVVDLR
ncbi:LolA family protein [Mucilaginibacter ginkgonis]|uniref:Outer membrane lipoprotein carrier protein LolA n=1 Tax=Mucilaginibacter ginkgonis TaxID=2682091 RepID=A0A6I4I1C3_9SPHI|nr:outer membrane lipoprotein carrier protein LolA [Mucilaginibacter ginkgonis]QQL48657.1 outer membrane lipoprotein carrier protein LolA [Mucilaginibacter ginkgonis]